MSDCADCQKKFAAVLSERGKWEAEAMPVLSRAASLLNASHPAIAMQLMTLIGDLNRMSLADKDARGGAIAVQS